MKQTRNLILAILVAVPLLGIATIPNYTGLPGMSGLSGISGLKVLLVKV